MSFWIIAPAVFALVLAAVFFLPSQIRLQAELTGAFARGKARVGLVYGLLGVTLRFSVCKNAAGRLETRVWHSARPEKIYTLPLPRDIIGAILRELERRSVKKTEKRRETHDEKHGSKRGKRRAQKRRTKGKFKSRWLRALLRTARVRSARVSGTFGAGDAAATALLSGAFSGAVKALLAPVMKAPPLISIEPNFSEEDLNLEFTCIVNLSHGKSTLESIQI